MCRGRELLEMEIDRFMVLKHDGIIIGCALSVCAGTSAGVGLSGGASRFSRLRAGERFDVIHSGHFLNEWG